MDRATASLSKVREKLWSLLGSRPFLRGQFGVQANIGEGSEASSHGIAVNPVSSQGEPNLSVVLVFVCAVTFVSLAHKPSQSAAGTEGLLLLLWGEGTTP